MPEPEAASKPEPEPEVASESGSERESEPESVLTQPAPARSDGTQLDLAVCLNAYSGYPLEEALEQVRDSLTCTSVELDAIEGLFSHVDLHRVGAATYRVGLVAQFRESGVQCRAVSAQRPAVDRLDAAGVSQMAALFELTRELGADRIILGAGTDEALFRRNIARLLEIASSLGLRVGLETQGPRQLVHDASCAQLVESIGSDILDVNYDFGNAYFATDGRLDMLSDFLALQPLVGHAHFKDARRAEDGSWELAPLTGGIVDYRALLAAIRAHPIPVSIELPRRMVLSSGTRRDALPALGEITADLSASLRYVTTLWDAAGA